MRIWTCSFGTVKKRVYVEESELDRIFRLAIISFNDPEASGYVGRPSQGIFEGKNLKQIDGFNFRGNYWKVSR